MQYYNLKLSVILKKDISSEEAYEKLSNLISYTMLKDNNLKLLHEENKYKNYVFCNLYPIEKDSIYKCNNIYYFDIRGIDLKLFMKLKQLLNIVEDKNFKVIQVNFETSIQRKITKLITLTPVIITTKIGDYDIKDNLEFVKNRLVANIQKKYKAIYNIEADVDFIKEIIKTNKKPIKIPYKNIHMLGNKFEIMVKEDPISQNLAYLMLSVGSGEKNSLGFGFCMAR